MDCAFVEFLRARFGEASSAALLREAASPSVRFSSCPYADSTLSRLMQAMARRHSVDPEVVGYEFGQYFVSYAHRQGYAKILSLMGANIVSFLRSVNNLHLHFSSGIPDFAAPGFVAPIFLVKEVLPTSLLLHYYSERPGLWSWVEGIVDEMSKQVFGMQVQMEMLMGRQQGNCDHEVYRVLFPAICDKNDEQQRRARGSCSLMGLDPELFYDLFPFHFVLDRQLRVLQVGSALETILPELALTGTSVRDVLQVQHPRVGWDLDRLLEFEKYSKVVLASNAGLELKGGLYRARLMRRVAGALAEGEEAVLFLGSPRMCNLDELKKHNLYLSDFPPHDMASDFVLLSEQRRVEVNLKEQAEMHNIGLTAAAEQLLEERDQAAHINSSLKEALAKSLEIGAKDGAGKPYISPDSPADAAITLLNSLLLGHEVGMEQVMGVRNMLLNAGANLWQPLEFNTQSMSKDAEVQAALAQMLGAADSRSEGDWLLSGPSTRPPTPKKQLDGSEELPCQASCKATQQVQARGAAAAEAAAPSGCSASDVLLRGQPAACSASVQSSVQPGCVPRSSRKRSVSLYFPHSPHQRDSGSAGAASPTAASGSASAAAALFRRNDSAGAAGMASAAAAAAAIAILHRGSSNVSSDGAAAAAALCGGHALHAKLSLDPAFTRCSGLASDGTLRGALACGSDANNAQNVVDSGGSAGGPLLLQTALQEAFGSYLPIHESSHIAHVAALALSRGPSAEQMSVSLSPVGGAPAPSTLSTSARAKSAGPAFVRALSGWQNWPEQPQGESGEMAGGDSASGAAGSRTPDVAKSRYPVMDKFKRGAQRLLKKFSSFSASVKRSASLSSFSASVKRTGSTASRGSMAPDAQDARGGSATAAAKQQAPVPQHQQQQQLALPPQPPVRRIYRSTTAPRILDPRSPWASDPSWNGSSGGGSASCRYSDEPVLLQMPLSQLVQRQQQSLQHAQAQQVQQVQQAQQAQQRRFSGQPPQASLAQQLVQRRPSSLLYGSGLLSAAPSLTTTSANTSTRLASSHGSSLAAAVAAVIAGGGGGGGGGRDSLASSNVQLHGLLSHTRSSGSTASPSRADSGCITSRGRAGSKAMSLFIREPAVLSQASPAGAKASASGPPTPINPQVLIKLLAQPPDLLLEALQKADDWQFDAFQLSAVSFGKPLSCLAFYLFNKMDLVRKFDLDEVKLARFLIRIEQGYPHNPYHCRTHAADVLRTLHVLLTRGGVLAAMAASARAHALSAAAGGDVVLLSGSLVQDADAQGDTLSATKLLTCYISAIIHDFEHRGVTNVFLVRSSDPLALLYNDSSPMENHHLAAAFTLMHDDQFAFFPWKSRRLKENVRKDVIELVMATDMKQHFSLTSIFASKVATRKPSHDAPVLAPASGHTHSSQVSSLDMPQMCRIHKRHASSHQLAISPLQPSSGQQQSHTQHTRLYSGNSWRTSAATTVGCGDANGGADTAHSSGSRLGSFTAGASPPSLFARGSLPPPATSSARLGPAGGDADGDAAAPRSLGARGSLPPPTASARLSPAGGDSDGAAAGGTSTSCSSLSHVTGGGAPGLLSSAAAAGATPRSSAVASLPLTLGSEEMLCGCGSPRTSTMSGHSWDADTQLLALKITLKCADLGHLASSSDVHKEWVGRLEEEMFRQGDQERALGQSISPLMDRSKGGVTKSQSGFFNVVALPMYKAFTQVFPSSTDILENVNTNYKMWCAVEAKAAESAVLGPTDGPAAAGAVDAAATPVDITPAARSSGDGLGRSPSPAARQQQQQQEVRVMPERASDVMLILQE